MSKTAYLRPLITSNFIFDFPSQFTTKEISDFSKTNYEETTKNASDSMQEIMQGHEVIWYVQSKSNQQIVGIVMFEFKNDAQTIANLFVELFDNLSKNEINEISERIVHICTTNLQLKEITISQDLNDTICLQLKNHYNVDNTKLINR